VAGAGDINGDGLDDLIVGAHGYDAGQSNEGAAFLYIAGLVGSVPTLALPVRALLGCLLLGISMFTLQLRHSYTAERRIHRRTP